MTLYEINQEIESLIAIAQEEEWEPEVIQDTLAALELEKNEKAENCALAYKNYIAEAEAYKTEAESFTLRRKQAERKAEWLKEYLAVMLAGESFKTDRAVVNFRKTKKVIIDDILQIPEEYMRYKEPEADKKELKKAIEGGASITGCHIEDGLSTTIK